MEFFPRQYIDSKFWKFILNPSEPISLKSYFDNIRNYTIAYSLYGIGIYLQKNEGDKLLFYFLYTIASILVLLNAFQLFVLLLKTFHSAIGISHEEYWSKNKTAQITMIIKTIILFSIPLGIIYFTWVLFNYFFSQFK